MSPTSCWTILEAQSNNFFFFSARVKCSVPFNEPPENRLFYARQRQKKLHATRNVTQFRVTCHNSRFVCYDHREANAGPTSSSHSMCCECSEEHRQPDRFNLPRLVCLPYVICLKWNTS